MTKNPPYPQQPNSPEDAKAAASGKERGFARISTWIDRVVTAMAWVAGVLMIIVMLAISYSVVMRYFFNSPAPSIIEVSSYLLLYITFLGAPWLLRNDGHVKVELVVDRLGPRRRRAADLASSFLGLVVSLTLFAQGSITTFQQYERATTAMNILDIPKYMLLVIIPFGSIFLSYEFGRWFLSALRREVR